MLEIDKPVLLQDFKGIPIESLKQIFKENGYGVLHKIYQYLGGYSNLTYLIETEKASVIIRRPPAGAEFIKSGHNMAREFDLLQKLHANGFKKAPRPLFMAEIAGVTFYAMEKLEGHILRAKNALIINEELTEQKQTEISKLLCEQLVSLHSMPINDHLATIGKPEDYVKRQVEGWSKRYENSKTEEIAAMNVISNWLIENLPKSSDNTLIHNDFKFDNVIFKHSDLSEIIAVLDWEMATIGDPLIDLGTCLSYWAEANDGPFEKQFNISWLKGQLTRNEFAEHYAKITKRDISQLVYYYVFGLFKNAIVMQQLYWRYKMGHTQDPRFAGLIAGVRILSQKALKSIETNKLK